MKITFGNFGRYQTMTDDRQYAEFLDLPQYIVFVARDCRQGERYTNEYTCVECQDGKNTYQVRTENEKGDLCEDCLTFGKC